MKTPVLVFTVVLLLGATGYFYARATGEKSALWPNEDRSGTMKFNHSKHTDVACTECHAAATSESANDDLLPKATTCKDCHDEKEIRTFLNIDPAVSLENFVIMRREKPVRFSHKAHLPRVNGECNTCHVNFTKIAMSSESPMMLPTMEVCATCHTDHQTVQKISAHAIPAPTACLTCHVTMTGLLPPSHRDADFRTEHKHVVRTGAQKENCAACHSDASCKECHSGNGVDVSATATRFYAPVEPRVEAMDNAHPMVIQHVHSLNYRNTHGVDADTKALECQTCHESSTFCAECHNSPRETVGFSAIPQSHGAAGFIALGVGSGGGLHAQLARRDIEQCASCHQQDGAEPACVKCHIDPDGIKGTNPRTHESGFLHDSHGPWHDDAGAACFVCHVDANAHPGGTAGKGFCGYCHDAKGSGSAMPFRGGSNR